MKLCILYRDATEETYENIKELTRDKEWLEFNTQGTYKYHISLDLIRYYRTEI